MSREIVSEKQFGRFIRWLGYSAGLAVLLLVVFVLVVDPYRLYGFLKYPGFNTVKPVLTKYVDEIKLSQAIKLKPDTIFLGNSRVEIGLDPESEVLTRKGYSAYNLGVRGALIDLSHRQLNYILHEGVRPKRVVMAVDFIDFMNFSGMALEDSPRPMQNLRFPVDKLYWRFDTLFSMASLKDSIGTLRIQRDNEAAVMTERGFNPLKEYLAMARNEGYFALFRQRAEENARTYLKKANGEYNPWGFFYLNSMINVALDAESDVIVIIYPYHAQIMALLEEAGLLPSFIQWKKQVVIEAEKYSVQGKHNKVVVVDFSGFGEYQCEKIPVKGDLRSETKWYWEAGHFKKALGDIILEHALQQLENPKPLSVDDTRFGVSLNSANFDANLHRINLEKQKCRETYPQMFAEAASLVSSLRK